MAVPHRILALLGLCLGGLAAVVESQSGPLTIVLTGQSMIRGDVRLYVPSAVPTMAPLLKGDVVFTNFEATVAESGQPNAAAPRQGNSLSPPASMDVLSDMGFNLFALSNNHSWDLKDVGIRNTLDEARRRSISHAGIGANLEEATSPGFLQTSKGTVALVAMASGLIPKGGSATVTQPGVNELRVEAGNRPNEVDANRILEAIRRASARAQLVIAYQHNHVYDKPFGTIFAEELPDRLVPPSWIKEWTRREVDAGADIVVMHGAPVVQGVEIYRGRPIFYDLGNFIFNLPLMEAVSLLEPIVWESVVASVSFSGKNLESITFRPIALNQMGRGQADSDDDRPFSLPEAARPFLVTRGLPAPATGEKATFILQRLADSSRAFGTQIQVKGDTAAVKVMRAN